MLINNINYLRENYPYIREELKDIEEDKDKKFLVEETRRGDKTLLYKNEDKEIYFHSKYDPIREAQTLIEEYKEIKNENIVFYGTGLGYHIDLLMTENPDNNYYIFEPIPELLGRFLSERDLTKSQYKNLKILSMGIEQVSTDVNKLIEVNRTSVHIVELPVHKQIFEEEFKVFYDEFLKIVKSKRSSLATDYTFQRRWIINSMKNLKEVLNTPNIMLEKRNKFKGKPVLLVAAGPSLNEEIENIRYIKENGLAYIVSVGSAINTLVYHDVHPHAATTYDPGKVNQKVFEKIKEQDIEDIPMIFGSSVGYETLENYPGEKYHMITSQDQIASYFLAEEDKELSIVLDAPTIAVVTMQLLTYLGFSKIILVGQNLAYVGSANHSEGVHYSKDITDDNLKNAIKVESVDGSEILTNAGYNRMRNQMEVYIENIDKDRVINTTQGGAKIKGAKFIELEKLIEDILDEKIVKDDWLEGHKEKYSKEGLKLKLGQMEKALADSRQSIREYNENLEKIYLLVRNGNFNQVNRGYQDLDVNIIELQSNEFFTSFILKMNRVQHKLLEDAVKIYKLEKNLYKKNIDLLNAYRVFIKQCVKDVKFIMPIYEEMKQGIIKYINE